MRPRVLGILLVSLPMTWILLSDAPSAQSTTASVRGRLTDSEGRPLRGLVIAIWSSHLGGGTQERSTGDEGEYLFMLLPPANDYFVTIDDPFYAPIEAGPLDLDAGKTTVLDLSLQARSDVTEWIRVDSRGNVVDPSSTKTSTSYNTAFIEGLPIIGHDYQDVLFLTPGVTDVDSDGNPNVHGARESGLQYRLEGGDVTDPASGGFGQNLNHLVIEEMETITAGATAEYGRAEGGFANILTRSGGNRLQGKLALYWQGSALNGNSPGNNDINEFERETPDWHDLRAAASVGGPFIRDELWYFSAVEVLNTEQPNLNGRDDVLLTSDGVYSFGKLTWRADPFNLVALQVASESRELENLGLSLLTAAESGFDLDREGLAAGLGWSFNISPKMLLETHITHFNLDVSVDPSSSLFEPIETVLVRGSTTGFTFQAPYPCSARNCDDAFGEERVYRMNGFTRQVNGPYFARSEDSRTRDGLRADLTYLADDLWGSHGIKGGFEITGEDFEADLLANPMLFDFTQPATTLVTGRQLLTISEPLETPVGASGFNTGLYIQDAWKPHPGLAINAGVRFDLEQVDTSGFASLDPPEERIESVALWRDFCDEALRQEAATGITIVTANSNCHPARPFNGLPPSGIAVDRVRSFMDLDMDGMNDVPAHIASLDVDQDGVINPDLLPDLRGLERELTNPGARETDSFEIENTNWSPRVGVSWDPWLDGKTRFFAHWGRYYDRLLLGSVAGDGGPGTRSFMFVPNPMTRRIDPGAPSIASFTPSINQVDRDLKTPRTDELSLGVERELAAEWSVGLSYINRKGYDLLQDLDLNHYTCLGADETIGIEPAAICGSPDGTLATDQFGDFFTSEPFQAGSFGFLSTEISRPNLLEDLYTLNNSFSEVLRVGNFNGYDYDALELRVLKRLHRSWQMLASYTWSEATGEAEEVFFSADNSADVVSDPDAHLAFDQRHVLRVQTVTHLPHGIGLGGVIQWASGTPWTIIDQDLDQDSTGNIVLRTSLPTGEINDQRNEGAWRIDGRIEKRFALGKIGISTFLIGENLLDSDDLTIHTQYDRLGIEATRELGRRFELGAILDF